MPSGPKDLPGSTNLDLLFFRCDRRGLKEKLVAPFGIVDDAVNIEVNEAHQMVHV